MTGLRRRDVVAGLLAGGLALRCARVGRGACSDRRGRQKAGRARFRCRGHAEFMDAFKASIRSSTSVADTTPPRRAVCSLG